MKKNSIAVKAVTVAFILFAAVILFAGCSDGSTEPAGENPGTDIISNTDNQHSSVDTALYTFNPSAAYKNGVYTVTVKDSSKDTDQWVNIISISNPNKTAGVAVDDIIRTTITIKSDKAITKLVFKNQFYAHDDYKGISTITSLKADVEKTLELYGIVSDGYTESESCLILDLRGNKADTKLTVSNIKVEKDTSNVNTQRPAVTLNASVTALEIAQKMGCGWNLGNTLDAHDMNPTVFPLNQGISAETLWGQPFTSAAIIKTGIEKAGYKTIRIPVTWFNHIIDTNYTIDPKWMNRVKQVVNLAIDAGYYVILNEHHSVHENMHNPIKHCEGYNINSSDKAESEAFLKAIWQQIVKAFNNEYDEHLIFETMNEPRNTRHEHEWGPFPNDCDECKKDLQLLNECNQLILDTIRASGGNNANRIVMIPPLATSVKGLTGDFKMPDDSAANKLMTTIHIYPLDAGGTGLYSHHFDDDTKTELLSQIEILRQNFVSKGIPALIGEYGAAKIALDRDTGKVITEYVVTDADRLNCFSYLSELCGKYSIPFVLWDVGDENEQVMASIHRQTCTLWEPELTKSVVDSWKRGNANPGAPNEPILEGPSSQEPSTEDPGIEDPARQDLVLYTSSDAVGTKISTNGYNSCLSLDAVIDLTGYKYLNIEFYCPVLGSGKQVVLQPKSGMQNGGHQQGDISSQTAITGKTMMQTKFGTNFGKYTDYNLDPPVEKTITDNNFGSVQIFVQSTTDWTAVDGFDVYVTKIVATNTEL